MTEKEQQNARARRGEAAVKVRFEPEPVDNSAYGRGARAGQVIRETANPTRQLRRAVQALPGVIPTILGSDAAAALIGTQPGRVTAMNFVDGLVGNPKGGKKVPVEKPVEEALAQGRQAAAEPNPIAPADRQSQMIAAILGSGLTVNEAAAVAGILPQPATGKNAPDTKDMIMAEAATVSKQILEQSIAEAQKLQAAGDVDAAQEVVSKAREVYFNQQAGLTGFNPLQIAQAQLMGGGQ